MSYQAAQACRGSTPADDGHRQLLLCYHISAAQPCSTHAGYVSRLLTVNRVGKALETCLGGGSQGASADSGCKAGAGCVVVQCDSASSGLLVPARFIVAQGHMRHCLDTV